ncbi:forkhead box l1 [Sarcoptes scabiei]|nr:forkhead box l1 [Sarcoptes scabiei]
MFQIRSKSIYGLAKNFLALVENNNNNLNNLTNCSKFLILINHRKFHNDSSGSFRSIDTPKQFHNSSKNSEGSLVMPVGMQEIVIGSATEKKSSPKLPKNIIFTPNPNYDDCDEPQHNGTSKRPLILLFGWMLSKEQHLNVYRKFWFERGWDVLSCRTLPMHLLLPSRGGRRNAEKMFEFLVSRASMYDEILVHAFSVGGYQLGEFACLLDERKSFDPKAKKMLDSFKAILIDSCVFAFDAPVGLSKAITNHRIVQPLLEKTFSTFLNVTSPFTLKRYVRVSDYLFKNEINIPGLVLFSKNDPVSSIPLNMKLHDGWKSNNPLTEYKCWDDSPHVLHYKNHQEEYTKVVDDFVANLNITKARRPN